MAATKRRARTVFLAGGNALPAAMVAKFRAAHDSPETSFTDIKFLVEEHVFRAHRLVLASCGSETFTALMKTPKGTVTVPGIEARTFSAILDYVYEGEITVDEADLPAILKAAAVCRLGALVEAATGAVQERLRRTPRSPPGTLSPPSPRPQGMDRVADACAASGSPVAATTNTTTSPTATTVTTSTTSTTTTVTSASIASPHAPDLYVLGGLHNGGSAERLNLATGASKSLGPIPDASRRGVAVASMHADHRLVAIGGHVGGTTVHGAVDMLDTRTGKWESGPPLGTARGYAGAVATPDGALYVIGGHDGSRRLRSGEVLKCGVMGWEPIAQMSIARVCMLPQPTLNPPMPRVRVAACMQR